MSGRQKFTLSLIVILTLAVFVWAQQPVLIQQGGHQAVVTAAGAVTVDGSAVTQPISGTVTANGGTGNFTVVQPTAANLNATVTGTVTASQGGAPWAVHGAVASGGANANNPVKIGGVFNTTQPTVTTGQIVDLQATARGALIVAPGVDPFNVILNAAIPAGANTIGAVNQAGTWNVTVNTALPAGANTIGSVNQAGAPWSFLGTLAHNGNAAAANRVPILPGIAQTSYSGGTAATAGNNSALNVGTDGLLWTAALPAIRPASYTASSKFAASSTTDNACLPGNASNTVLLTELRVSGVQTTAGILNAEIIKRSTADTAGTSASMTVVPDDSNYAAGSSAPLSYTGTGPTVGTAVGDIDNAEIGFMAAGTAAPNDIYVGNFRMKPIVLRGTAQEACVNLGGAVTGGTMTVTFKWIETATITP